MRKNGKLSSAGRRYSILPFKKSQPKESVISLKIVLKVTFYHSKTGYILFGYLKSICILVCLSRLSHVPPVSGIHSYSVQKEQDTLNVATDTWIHGNSATGNGPYL